MSTMPFLIDLNNKPMTNINVEKPQKMNNNQVMVAYTTHTSASTKKGTSVTDPSITDVKYITGWLNQDNISLKSTNDWDTLYNVMGGGSWNTINSLLAGMTQTSFIFDTMLQKMWMKSSPQPLDIKLRFIARNDPIEEVWNPVFKLFAMAHPIKAKQFTKATVEAAANNIPTKGLLDTIKDSAAELLGKLFSLLGNPTLLGAPNSSIVGVNNGEMPYFLYLKIGNMLTLQDCILTNVSISFPMSNQMTSKIDNIKRATPLSADVTLSIVPQLIWTKKSIMSMRDERYTEPIKIREGGINAVIKLVEGD